MANLLKKRRGKQKKYRDKSISIKVFCYDVPDKLCDRVDVKEVTKKSGATINQRPSTALDKTTFLIRGTQSQNLEALRLISTMTGEQMRELQKAQQYWLEWTKTAFPEFDSHTYFLPPVHIRRVPMTQKDIACQHVSVMNVEDQPSLPAKHPSVTPSSTEQPQICNISCVQQSDMYDDEAIQLVLIALKTLSKRRIK